MSYNTLVMEIGAPFLVLLPISFLNWRILAAAIFISFHLGLAITMELGTFPWACMAAWLLVLPPSFWQFIDQFKDQRWMNLQPIYRGAQWLKGRFGDDLRVPRPRLRFGWIQQAVVSVLLSVVICWNLTHFENLHLYRPDMLRAFANATFTYQKWSMFAPFPRKDDGWFVIEGELINGKKVDLWSQKENAELSFDIPLNMAATFRNTLWRKYLTNIWLVSYKDYRLYFGRYLCRKWNDDKKSQGEMVNTIQVHYMSDMTPPPGQALGEVKKNTIWRHYCFDKPNDWEE